jgi:hypothetical protein
MELEIVARDVVGTAHSNATVAADKLQELLGRSSSARYSVMAPSFFREVAADDLRAIEHLLAKAISDVMLAQHMLSNDWEPTLYLGEWDR